MAEIYNQRYISKLKKNRAYLSAAFFVLVFLMVCAYILSIVLLSIQALSIVIAAAGVLGLAAFYILLICPLSAVLKVVREAQAGLKNKEKMYFEGYGEEQLKDGVYYVVMKVKVPCDDCRSQERELLVQKGLEPALARGEAFMANTFQRVLLGYEKISAENP